MLKPSQKTSRLDQRPRPIPYQHTAFISKKTHRFRILIKYLERNTSLIAEKGEIRFFSQIVSRRRRQLGIAPLSSLEPRTLAEVKRIVEVSKSHGEK